MENLATMSKVVTMPKVGDEILVNNKIRCITSITRNINGLLIICWESQHLSGACMPSQWIKWSQDGKDTYTF